MRLYPIRLALTGHIGNHMRIFYSYLLRFFDKYLIPYTGIAVGYGLYPVPPGSILIGDAMGYHAITALPSIRIACRLRRMHQHGNAVMPVSLQVSRNIK